jgi:hypothetical protein
VVAVVVVCKRVRLQLGLSLPLARSLLGWIGGYLRASPASVDGMNAKNGLDRLVFNFFHTLKITLCRVGLLY